jgi:hypothetical protein
MARLADARIRAEGNRNSNVRRRRFYWFKSDYVPGCRHVVTRSGDSLTLNLIGLTIHGSTEVPVLRPDRVPRLEGEDTASVILTRGGVGDAAMISRSTSNPTGE